MTAILLFILLVIIAVVAMAIVNQHKVELGSRAEDILLEQARVAELRTELEQAGTQEREELTALRLEMQILEKESAKNVLTLEKELIASGLKGKDAEDALRKELEETRLSEQVKVAAIQAQLDKAKILEQAKVKTIQSELDKSQARIGLMETNVEKLKNKPAAEIADLKKKLSEAMVSTRDAQEKANAQASLVKAEKSEAAKELKAIQDELNRLKEVEADKRKTLNTKLGDSVDTIEDLEEEIGYLKNQAAIYASEKAAAKKAAAKKAAIEKAAAEKAAAEKAAAEKAAAEKAAIEKVAAIDNRPDSIKESTNPEEFTSSAPFKHIGDGRLRPGHSGYPYSQFKTKEKGGVEPGIPKGAVDECQAKCKTDPTCPGISMERHPNDDILCMHFRKQTGTATHQSCVYPPFSGECGTGSTRVSASDRSATYWRGTRTRANTWARPESSWFGTPTPDPDDFSGYTDNGNGFCKSGQLFSSSAYALLNPGESRTKAPTFDDPLYKEYAKRGQDKCDADPKCNHVTVWRNAGYRMYDTDNCADKHDTSGSNRSWKKYGNGNRVSERMFKLKEELKKRGLDTTGPKADLVARLKEAGGAVDSLRESIIPEKFTSSAPFKPLGKWGLNEGLTGYPYTQFFTKSKVKEVAVDECQAECKKDPTCPGISIDRRTNDGSINCMVYKKQSGNASNDVCVYPPFENTAAVSEATCNYAPFDPSKNYPSTPGYSGNDNYSKFCKNLVDAKTPECALKLCTTTDAKNACKGECDLVLASAPETHYSCVDGFKGPHSDDGTYWRGTRTTSDDTVKAVAKAKATAFAELEASLIGKPDSVRESTIPEKFTGEKASAPFKRLGKWRLSGGATGYPYTQFITKSKVKELAVDECQAACKKDPTCPGIAMERYGDGAINCMRYRKQSGNASNDLCVYPPFKTDEYNCVRNLGGESPGTYWRGTRTRSTASIEADAKAEAAAFAELEASIIGKPDSVRESAIPETFTSSAPFKPLGKWRLDPGPSGYPYSQFITKSKVKELAVDECQAKCKADPTCPGISMERYGDGAINCMHFRKQTGKASNELCVYPPFGDDCVRGLGGDSPGTYWRGTGTTSTASVEVAGEKAAADKTFAKEQAALCSERDVTGKPMSTNWQVFGKCQPDPKDPKKGRKLLQKGYIDHSGKCVRSAKFEECSQDCEYKSGSYLGPSGWFGWMGGTGKNKDAGLVVSRHKVIYPAIGKSKSCCRQLGCPNDCIDPPPGEYIHKDRGVVINSDKLKYGYNDRCDGWGNACHVDKDIWNMFKGRFNKKAEIKKKYGAKFPQLGGACATPTMSPGQYAKDSETRKLYYYG